MLHSIFAFYLDGNIARRAFRDPVFLSQTCDVPIDIINDFWNLYVALASPLPLCPNKIRTFCIDFEERYDKAFEWHPLPPAVGQVIDHFHQAKSL